MLLLYYQIKNEKLLYELQKKLYYKSNPKHITGEYVNIE